jgi:hypothetical protein
MLDASSRPGELPIQRMTLKQVPKKGKGGGLIWVPATAEDIAAAKKKKKKEKAEGTPVKDASEGKKPEGTPVNDTNEEKKPEGPPVKDTKGEKKPGAYAEGLADENGLVDTDKLTLRQKQQLLRQLQTQGDKTAESLVQQLTQEIQVMAPRVVSEEQLLKLDLELDRLIARNPKDVAEPDKLRARQLAFNAMSALEFLSTFDEGDVEAIKFRSIILGLLHKIEQLDATALKDAREKTDRDEDLQVSPVEIEAYRADIKGGGVWGGAAEAQIVAVAFNVRLDMFMLDREGKYFRAASVGPPAGGAVSPFNIVNVGDHYVVIPRRLQPGQKHDAKTIAFNPPGLGDCMFDAFGYAASNNWSVPLQYMPNGANAPVTVAKNKFVSTARGLASSNLTDAQITLSIEEVLLSGQTAGVGPNLKKLVNLRRYDKGTLFEMISDSGLPHNELLTRLTSAVPDLKGKASSIESVLNLYEQDQQTIAEAKNVAELPKGMVTGMLTLLDALRTIVVEQSLMTGGPSVDEQSEAFELDMRKSAAEKFRVLYDAATSKFNTKQLIVDIAGNDCVLDRIGQLTPRYAYRSVSMANETELVEHGGIFPSGVQPVAQRLIQGSRPTSQTRTPRQRPG